MTWWTCSYPLSSSSGSFAGLGFLAWYLAGKLKAFDRKGHIAKLCLVFLPLLVASLVAVSRVDDYWHHWQDVFAGGILGLLLLCHFSIQHLEYPWPFTLRSHRRSASLNLLSSFQVLQLLHSVTCSSSRIPLTMMVPSPSYIIYAADIFQTSVNIFYQVFMFLCICSYMASCVLPTASWDAQQWQCKLVWNKTYRVWRWRRGTWRHCPERHQPYLGVNGVWQETVKHCTAGISNVLILPIFPS